MKPTSHSEPPPWPAAWDVLLGWSRGSGGYAADGEAGADTWPPLRPALRATERHAAVRSSMGRARSLEEAMWAWRKQGREGRAQSPAMARKGWDRMGLYK